MFNFDQDKLGLLLLRNMVWFIVILIFILFSILLPKSFLTLRNLHYTLYFATMIGLLTFAEALCLISGNFDLSVGQMAGFTAMFSAVFIQIIAPGTPGWIGIIVILIFGAICGAFNGFFIGKLGLNPFLVTLSTYLMYDFLTLAIRREAVRNLPSSYLAAGGARMWEGGMYMAVPIFFAIAFILHFVLTKTRLGSYIFSVGGNAEAARRCGIKVDNVLLVTFTISGVLAAMSGLLYTGYANVAYSNLAENTLFLAFAGAVIGGVDLAGGRGSIGQVIGGIILLSILSGGLTMLNISPAWRGVFKGGLVLAAILINRTRRRIEDKILAPSQE